MNSIANWLAVRIKNNVPGLTELQIIKIKFGIECLLSEASKIIIYAVLFSFLSLTKEYFTSLIFFTVLRGFAGGYHEETYWRCFITSLLILSSCIYLGITLQLNIIVKTALLLVCIVLVYIFAPVDHPNKPIISEKRRKKLKYLSIGVLAVLGFISVNLPDRYSNVALLSIFMESLSLIFGYIKKERLKENLK